jgi:trehalose 6-phosphate synthase
MMVKLRAGTIQQWFADFVDTLEASQSRKTASEPPISEKPPVSEPPPVLWPLRSANSNARYH